MNLDISIEEPWAADTDWEGLAAHVAQAAATVAPALANPRLTASLLFTADEEVHTLNREWRGKDRPTNVLSFPMLAPEDLAALPAEGPPELLGDIALAFETCAGEARRDGLLIEDHAAHLLLHGLLHLAGYDHETGPDDARTMEQLEIKALALLGIANPYGGLA